MSKALFVNGNLYGHINPTLPVVKELVQRGEEVYYFSTKEFQKPLEATGAIFMDYGEAFHQFLNQFQAHGNHPFYTLMEYMLAFDRTVIPIILEKVPQISPDYILHDAMFGGGSILARKLNLPGITSCSSFILEKPPLPERMLEPGFHPQLDYLYQELKAAETEWGTVPLQISDIFFQREELVLAYTSRLFHPLGENYDSTYRFVGPSIMDREENLDFALNTTKNKNLIYISLGTIHNNCMDFYQKCFEAFSGENDQVIMSVGNKTDLSALQPVPDNFIVRNYIPQLEVLKKADVFLSHGGLNSVSEALYYGVPVIAIPMSNDQPAVAKRLKELGAGIELKMEDITPSLLKQTVRDILSNQEYQIHCKEIRTSFETAGGYQAAADEIIKFVRRKHIS